MIQLENLFKEYQSGGVATPVLFEVNCMIEKGEFISIMGPSGSGKSTLMHIMGFLDSLSSGKYFFEGKDVSQLSDEELAYYRNQRVGFVFQSFNLLERTTVFENVRLPLLYGSKKDHKKYVSFAIESVGLSHRLFHYSNQLSGGEKQRVAIARALVNDPDIIFADEPTGNLDSKSGLQIMSILQRLNDEGRTIILVTHERYTSEHAKRMIQIRDGRIVSDDPIKERRRAADLSELK